MTKLIGDRKGKSALDEMEEVARERNADVAEEERLERLKKAKEVENPKKAKAPSEPVKAPVGNIMPVSYNGLEFEALAPRKDNDSAKDKERLTYDKSLARIRKAKFERHASPSEAFSLIADNLEGKLTGNLKAVADDMLSSYGEWLSMAVERKGDTLTCYLHPDEGLAWDKDKKIYWRKGSFKYDSLQEFDISGKESETWIPLDKFDNDFVNLFYGRSFNGLPKEMRQGSDKAHVVLPADGELWPVGRNFFGWFGVVYYYGRASRGVSRASPAGRAVVARK